MENCNQARPEPQANKRPCFISEEWALVHLLFFPDVLICQWHHCPKMDSQGAWVSYDFCCGWLKPPFHCQGQESPSRSSGSNNWLLTTDDSHLVWGRGRRCGDEVTMHPVSYVTVPQTITENLLCILMLDPHLKKSCGNAKPRPREARLEGR